VSFHAHSGQYYVTRGGKRIYLGADPDEALVRYHRLALGQQAVRTPPPAPPAVFGITVKELVNRFLATQQANWRNPQVTLRGYKNWFRRFLLDHRGLRAEDLTIEMFAAWKLSLRKRGYSQNSINHFLGAIRALYRFADDSGLLTTLPKLRRVRNEPAHGREAQKRIYDARQIGRLLQHADPQLRTMLLLALNCGFGPKDIQDLRWEHLTREHATLPRSKTGIVQTFRLWPETQAALARLEADRAARIARLAKRGRVRTDNGHLFVTKFWRPWNKDAVAEQFRRLCRKAEVPCYGFYRLRHSASTAIALEASPHVQRRFLRHSQLQQQVTYTHVPDSEVDDALVRARARLLSSVIEDRGNDPESE
jgi:integrase